MATEQSPPPSTGSGQAFLDRRDPERGTGVRVSSSLERHLQSIIVSLIAGGVIWVGTSVTELSVVSERSVTKLDGMETAFTALERRLTTLQDRLAASYQASDARRDLEARDQAIIRLEERIRSLERALSTLETRVQPGQAPRQEAPAPPVLPPATGSGQAAPGTATDGGQP